MRDLGAEEMIDTNSQDFQTERFVNFARRASRRRAVLICWVSDWITGNGVALFALLFLPLIVDLPGPLASNPLGHPTGTRVAVAGGDRGPVGDL
jgi:hypothetical protein